MSITGPKVLIKLILHLQVVLLLRGTHGSLRRFHADTEVRHRHWLMSTQVFKERKSAAFITMFSCGWLWLYFFPLTWVKIALVNTNAPSLQRWSASFVPWCSAGGRCAHTNKQRVSVNSRRRWASQSTCITRCLCSSTTQTVRLIALISVNKKTIRVVFICLGTSSFSLSFCWPLF